MAHLVVDALRRQVATLTRGNQTLLMALDKASGEVATLTESLAETQEELEANRACNRFTWKDRACKAEQQVATLTEALDRVIAYIETAMRPISIKEACGEGIWDAHRSGLKHALNAIHAEFEKAESALAAIRGER